MGNCKSFGRTRGRNGPAIQCRAVAGKYQGRERSQSKGPRQSEGGGRGQSNRQGQGPALVDSTTRSEPENPLEGWCVQSPRKGAARTATLGDENGMCDEGLRVIFAAVRIRHPRMPSNAPIMVRHWYAEICLLWPPVFGSLTQQPLRSSRVASLSGFYCNSSPIRKPRKRPADGPDGNQGPA